VLTRIKNNLARAGACAEYSPLYRVEVGKIEPLSADLVVGELAEIEHSHVAPATLAGLDTIVFVGKKMEKKNTEIDAESVPH
jgi:hypothetical protein